MGLKKCLTLLGKGSHLNTGNQTKQTGQVKQAGQVKQTGQIKENGGKPKVLLAASVASMIVQFNMPNIKLLLNMGYEVHVACNLKEGNTCSGTQIEEFKAKMQRMQVTLYQWDCPRSAYAVCQCIKAYQQLWGITGRSAYAWIHCHSPVGGALARIAAHRRGIPVIYTAHGFHFCNGLPKRNWLLYYPAEKLLSYWTDVLVTVNREDARFARKHFHAGRQYYIPGAGVAIEKFQSDAGGLADAGTKRFQSDAGGVAGCSREEARRDLRRQLNIPQTAVLLLSVGELSRRKNHAAVLRVLAGLHREDAYYLICGQGPMRKKLLCQARRYGVAGRVRMPGYLEDIRAAYQAADIFVFPSKQEGLPVALVEAMAAGLPCIVSDIRGNRELIQEAACRFAPGHLGQMREMLVRLMDDAGQRRLYGGYNQNNVHAYRLQAVQTKMGRIYRQVYCQVHTTCRREK